MNNRITEIVGQCTTDNTLDINLFAQRIINECAIVARNYTLKSSGLTEDFGGITNVEIEIRKLYG